MAASDALHPYQMRMFMQAKELMNITSGHTDLSAPRQYAPMSESPNLYAQKLAESKTGSAPSTFFKKKKGKESLHDSIKREGVTSPVHLKVFENINKDGWEEQINDGHHRVASANDINPEMYIPVRY